MRRIAASVCLLLAVACGSKKDKNTPETKDKPTAEQKDNKPAEPPKPAMTKEQMLQRVWAAPKSADGTRQLISFKADGTYSYYAFDGKAWGEPQTDKYTTEGDVLKDSGNTYKLTVAEDKLSLDNDAKDKTDFMDWHVATKEDCDGSATPPCPAAADMAGGAPAPASTPASTPAK